MDLNKVELIGRMTADPKARVVEDAVRCVSVRLASSHGSKDTEFLTVVMFGQLAKVTAEYSRKGTESTSKDASKTMKSRSGARRKAVEVVVHNPIMLRNQDRG